MLHVCNNLMLIASFISMVAYMLLFDINIIMFQQKNKGENKMLEQVIRTPRKLRLINKIDVKFREIENCEDQFSIILEICNHLKSSDLNEITKKINKILKKQNGGK